MLICRASLPCCYFNLFYYHHYPKCLCQRGERWTQSVEYSKKNGPIPIYSQRWMGNRCAWFVRSRFHCSKNIIFGATLRLIMAKNLQSVFTPSRDISDAAVKASYLTASESVKALQWRWFCESMQAEGCRSRPPWEATGFWRHLSDEKHRSRQGGSGLGLCCHQWSEKNRCCDNIWRESTDYKWKTCFLDISLHFGPGSIVFHNVKS